MTSQRMWMTGLAAAVVTALMIAAVPMFGSDWARAAIDQNALPEDFEVVVDCAPGGGIDAVCNLPGGTTSTTVDVVPLGRKQTESTAPPGVQSTRVSKSLSIARALSVRSNGRTTIKRAAVTATAKPVNQIRWAAKRCLSTFLRAFARALR